MTENLRNEEGQSRADFIREWYSEPARQRREAAFRRVQLRLVVSNIAEAWQEVERNSDSPSLYRAVSMHLSSAMETVIGSFIRDNVTSLPQYNLEVGERARLDLDGQGFTRLYRYVHRPGHHDNYFKGWVRVVTYNGDTTWLDNYQEILDQVTRLE